MDLKLEQIRKNLLSASASLNAILPYPPIALKQELVAAWERYFRLVEMVDAARPRPGKPLNAVVQPLSPQNLGILPFVIAGVVGLVALMGGGAYIAYELNESDRMAKLSKCIADATKQGMPLSQAQDKCNQLYGKQPSKPIIDVGVGGLNTSLLLMGGLGVLGLVIATKYL